LSGNLHREYGTPLHRCKSNVLSLLLASLQYPASCWHGCNHANAPRLTFNILFLSHMALRTKT
jgi:hypothetical protein